MQLHLDHMQKILDKGYRKGDRTGTGVTSHFGELIRLDISEGRFPLITTKKSYLRSFIHETLWFISGSTNIEYLKKNNVSIWDSWIKDNTHELDENGNLIGGELGDGVYGKAWRRLEDTRIVKIDEFKHYSSLGYKFHSQRDSEIVMTRTIDQLQNAIDLLNNNPESRRIIVHAFDNRYLEVTALPPCHSFFQFFSRELSIEERIKEAEHRLVNLKEITLEGNDPNGINETLDDLGVPKRALSLLFYMRSSDVPVAFGFNVGNYTLLAHLVAQVTNHATDELIYVGADTHVYDNQIDLVKEQLSREPLHNDVRILINKDIKDIDSFKFEDIVVTGYDNFHPPIKYPVAV